MKCRKILAIFSSLLILNSTLSTSYIQKTLQIDKKLSNYVCKITKDIIKSKTDTQDVLIGNLGGKIWSPTLNDIASCVGSDNALVLTDFNALIDEQRLRKAAVVVLAFGFVDAKTISTMIPKHVLSTVWHHMAKVICLFRGSFDSYQYYQVIMNLLKYGFQNFALISEDVVVLTLQTLSGSLVGLNSSSNGLDLFPDKLKNFYGFTYRVMACYQKPRVNIENGEVKAAMLHFFKAVAQKQNAGLHLMMSYTCKDIAKYWQNRKMDIDLTSAVNFDAPSIPKLLTYEEDGHCALVPLPQKVPLFQVIFIEPFDGWTWLFLVLTVACCFAAWLLFNKFDAVDSPWLLAYGMFVMFIGQGVDFSRQNRLVLAILLQLIIVMIWVLSNAYEGVVTSFMIQPIHEHRLETFDDLIASNYDIMTDSVFEYWMKQSKGYEKFKTKFNVSSFNYWEELQVIFEQAQKAMIFQCEQARLILSLSLSNGDLVSDHYYPLQKPITSHFVRLEASYLNPFIERLQYFMDLCFQAGLMHMWKIFEAQDDKITIRHHMPNNAAYLKLLDMTQVFSILLISYAVSILVFLIEFFLFEFIKKVKLLIIARKLRNRVHLMAYKKKKQPKHPKYQKGALYYIIHRHKRIKRLKARKLKVRRIYVQPRFSID